MSRPRAVTLHTIIDPPPVGGRTPPLVRTLLTPGDPILVPRTDVSALGVVLPAGVCDVCAALLVGGVVAPVVVGVWVGVSGAVVVGVAVGVFDGVAVSVGVVGVGVGVSGGVVVGVGEGVG